MNLTHLKYAVTIAKTNSINKAADELFVGAPAMSRAIKELELDLGVTLFERSAKGMFLTSDGKLFVEYASKVLKEVDDIENIFKTSSDKSSKFSIYAPRATYINDAFKNFSLKVTSDSNVELLYKEADADTIINKVLKEDGGLGIFRYSQVDETYYKSLVDEKGIVGELIVEFSYQLLMSKKSPLNNKKNISFSDLASYNEIAHPDYLMNLTDLKKDEVKGNRILISDYNSQFELLDKNPNTYMWISSVSKDILSKYNLIERKCGNNIYKDVLINRAGYRFSELDRVFIEELIKVKREYFNE
jgi:DNA-binding transcriptional LysR family regulator